MRERRARRVRVERALQDGVDRVGRDVPERAIYRARAAERARASEGGGGGGGEGHVLSKLRSSISRSARGNAMYKEVRAPRRALSRSARGSVHARDHPEGRAPQQRVRPRRELDEPAPQRAAHRRARAGGDLGDGAVDRHDERRGAQARRQARTDVNEQVQGERDLRRLLGRARRRALAASTHAASCGDGGARGAHSAHGRRQKLHELCTTCLMRGTAPLARLQNLRVCRCWVSWRIRISAAENVFSGLCFT